MRQGDKVTCGDKRLARGLHIAHGATKKRKVASIKGNRLAEQHVFSLFNMGSIHKHQVLLL